MKRIFIFVATTVSLLAGNLCQADAAKTISDSLVQNLRCDSLSLGSMLGSIRPDAFDRKYHLPMKNFGFKSSAGFEIGGCWAFSSTQRKLFYLLRYNEANAPEINKLDFLNMIRGSVPARMESPFETGESIVVEPKYTNYKVLPLNEPSINEGYHSLPGTSFFDKMTRPEYYDMDGITVRRNLQSAIKGNQEKHFFRAGNLKMALTPGTRDRETNFATLLQLKSNLRMNRLTLVNLRLEINPQHVVVAKSFKDQPNGDTVIYAYDSNEPDVDQQIYFNKRSAQFFAVQAMKTVVTLGKLDANYRAPVAAYIVDEDERAELEQTLLKYYKNLCK